MKLRDYEQIVRIVAFDIVLVALSSLTFQATRPLSPRKETSTHYLKDNLLTKSFSIYQMRVRTRKMTRSETEKAELT